MGHSVARSPAARLFPARLFLPAPRPHARWQRVGDRREVTEPLRLLGVTGAFNVKATVRSGGLTGKTAGEAAQPKPPLLLLPAAR